MTADFVMSGAIAAALLLPVVTAVTIVLTGRWENCRDGLGVCGAIVTFAIVCWITGNIGNVETASLVLARPLPGFDLLLRLEPFGLLFALVASGLWIVTGLYAIGYMRGHQEKNQTRFFACFAIAIAAAIGIAFSGNLVTLFTFYEILSLTTYPLVTHHGNAAAKRAGRLYLGTLFSTSILFLLLAVIWTGLLAGTTDFRLGGILRGHADVATMTILLGLFIFGTAKAAVMPFHRWLPSAMVAPTPVSALLHAVAVVKAGVFTILKVTIYIFGIDTLARFGIRDWLLPVAAFTVVVASVIAIGQENLKARLAYSTISQLGYIVLGALIAAPAAAVGAGMHIAMHAFAKITLFFCAGSIYVLAHKTEVSDLDGIARRMPLTMAAFTLASAGVIGLPLAGGMWSKWAMLSGALDAGVPLYAGIYLLSSLLSIGYLGPIIARAYFRPLAGEDSSLEKGQWLLVGAPLLTALGSLILFFAAEPIYRFLIPVVGQ